MRKQKLLQIGVDWTFHYLCHVGGEVVVTADILLPCLFLTTYSVRTCHFFPCRSTQKNFSQKRQNSFKCDDIDFNNRPKKVSMEIKGIVSSALALTGL